MAGRNGAGKTTLLRVLAMALSQLSPDYAETMFGWLRPGAKTGSSRLVLVPSDEDQLQRDVKLLSTKAADDDLEVGDTWEPGFGAMTHRRESDGNRAFAGPWHPEPRGWFAVGYGPHRRLFGAAAGSERWSTGTTREGSFLTLFRDDAALTHPIRWLMELHHRKLDPHATKAERSEAGQLLRGTLRLLNTGILADVEVLDVDSKGLWIRQDGHRFAVSDLGSGAQLVLVLVLDIVRNMCARFGARGLFHGERAIVKHGGVILLDEADAHLHVSWQQRLGPWLTEHFPGIQFIVTTHSPFICQSAVEGGLVLLPAPGSSERARVAPPALYNRVVNGSVDDALLSELFGMEHTWSEAAEQRRERLSLLEGKVLSGRARPAEIEAYQRLRHEVALTLPEEVSRVAARALSSDGRPTRP
ncbi:MAG: AAA family ATPase [Deltaproteobacteria bacterium]|nr:AAA family ATPase [Deltaproteobacteria bacterium]